jgi:hypothetical protein
MVHGNYFAFSSGVDKLPVSGYTAAAVGRD